MRFMALALERDVGDHLAQSLHFTNDEAVGGTESCQAISLGGCAGLDRS